MLWPRVLYWFAFTLMCIALFYAITGTTVNPGLDHKSLAQSGGGLFGVVALVGLVIGKIWMDHVVRRRSLLRCPRCQAENSFMSEFCVKCGQQLRITAVTEASQSFK